MSWTKTPPTERGWYHVRYPDGEDHIHLLEQEWYIVGYAGAETSEHLVHLGCEFWPEPIPSPKE